MSALDHDLVPLASDQHKQPKYKTAEERLVVEMAMSQLRALRLVELKASQAELSVLRQWSQTTQCLNVDAADLAPAVAALSTAVVETRPQSPAACSSPAPVGAEPLPSRASRLLSAEAQSVSSALLHDASALQIHKKTQFNNSYVILY